MGVGKVAAVADAEDGLDCSHRIGSAFVADTSVDVVVAGVGAAVAVEVVAAADVDSLDSRNRSNFHDDTLAAVGQDFVHSLHGYSKAVALEEEELWVVSTAGCSRGCNLAGAEDELQSYIEVGGCGRSCQRCYCSNC